MLSQEEIHKIAAVESEHWWYRGMREMFFALLAPYLGGSAQQDSPSGGLQQLRILDIGCGTGGNLIELSTLGEARGIDADPLCVEYCRHKGLDVRLGTMERLEERPGSFDLVTTFDVICQADRTHAEHIFRGIADALAPGGLLALRESAMPIAAGAHDRAVGIRHRFTRADLGSLLTRVGLEPLRLTYVNSLLFAPIVLQRRIGNMIDPTFTESDVKPAPAPLNSALLEVLRLEKHLLRLTDLPFGVSVFAIARKKTSQEGATRAS